MEENNNKNNNNENEEQKDELNISKLTNKYMDEPNKSNDKT